MAWTAEQALRELGKPLEPLRTESFRLSFNSRWTPELDERLAEGMDAGMSYAQIARELGVSRNAAIGRSYRLRGCDQSYQRQEQTHDQQSKRLTRQQAVRTLIVIMHEELAAGMPRRTAFGRAWARGAGLQAIGDSVGLSRERIRQIIKPR
jgi:DNA-directed RNA polymerase sigma subunit (sigma70/sigma32)